jgi:hypothetical protein
MQEPDMKGEAAPSWPRVMRRLPARGRRSVDRGKRRSAIELRNHPIQGADLVTFGGRQHGKEATDSEPTADPAESETLSMRGRSVLENREISAVPVWQVELPGRTGKACGL